jgi:hypothetical protein
MQVLHPPHFTRFWMHGVFLPYSTHPSESVLLACSVARRCLLESLNKIDDLPVRVKNIVRRELVHQSRWTASSARTHHPTASSSCDITPLPVDLASGFHEVREDIPTSCVAVGLMYQLASRQRELRSARPAPPTAASSPSLLAKLRQQKIQFLRAASVPAVSSHRIKIRSPSLLISPAQKPSPSYKTYSPPVSRSSSSPQEPAPRPLPLARSRTYPNRPKSSSNSRTHSSQWTFPPRSRVTPPPSG